MVTVKGVVDADAHVDETDETWEYMTAEDAKNFKPISIDPPALGQVSVRGDVRPHRLWLVDGRTGLRRWRSDERTGTTMETRELMDVKARLRHMDEMGVETQVIYPTYLLSTPSPRPDVELAIYKSYNRWLADKTEESNGRLRWAVMPPYRSMEKCLEEIRWGKEHGAVGIFKRAIEWDGKNVANPAWYPIYEECERLDMAICCHTGGENFTRSGGDAGGAAVANIGCFSVLSQQAVPDRFPKLRFGVIEAMASWFPYVLSTLKADQLYSGSRSTYAQNPLAGPKADFLKDNRFYVTCQTSEDVPYMVSRGGTDALMIGTDYSHDDRSGVISALDFIEGLGEDGQISMEVVEKILSTNPKKFYGLD